MNRYRLLVSGLLMVVCWLTEYNVCGQTLSERFDDWPVRLKINGRLAIAAELQDVRLLDELLTDSLNTAACLLITDDSPTPLVAKAYEQLFASLKSIPSDQLHAFEPASIPPFIAWHVNQWPLVPDALTATKREQLLAWLANQLEAGKTIVVTGSGAQAVGKWVFSGNRHHLSGPDWIYFRIVFCN